MSDVQSMIEVQPEEDKLSGHEYDGIQEYDNPTPGWWHLIFFLSFVFSVFYALWYHSTNAPGRSIHEKYEAEVTEYYEMLFADVGTLEPDQPTILRVMHDPDLEQFQPVAEAIFTSKCAACHGAAGQGGTGPNMTDDAYLHVTDLEDIARVISEGAAAGAMPAWEARLHPNQITLLAGYVANLRSSDIPGKAPEGKVAPPWPEWNPEDAP